MSSSSSDSNSNSNSNTSNSSTNLSQLARVDVEPPSKTTRKMRLMFGERREGQVVTLRADGLRSRAVREEAEAERSRRRRVDDVIADVVADSRVATSSSSSSPEEPAATSSSAEPQPGDSSSSRIDRWQRLVTSEAVGGGGGNRKYHPPTRFHGAGTMVEHKKRWTYQMASDIDAAERSDDGQMYYIAHPFLPMPRGHRRGNNGDTSTSSSSSSSSSSVATRMNYAAQRLDNRKFRGQVAAVNGIAADAESVTCEKCGMRFFFESLKMQQRISYLQPINEEDLPTVLFECPVCKTTTRADDFL